jgi:hypothetical protein
MFCSIIFLSSLIVLVSSQTAESKKKGKFITMADISPEELAWVYKISADDYVPGIEIPPPKDAHKYEETNRRFSELFTKRRKRKNQDVDFEFDKVAFEIGTPKDKKVEEMMNSTSFENINSNLFNWKRVKNIDIARKNYLKDIVDENGNFKNVLGRVYKTDSKFPIHFI